MEGKYNNSREFLKCNPQENEDEEGSIEDNGERIAGREKELAMNRVR